jgi:hypothetical protein
MCGVMPEGFLLSTGQIAPLNDGQKYLNEIIAYALDGLPDEIDHLILDGDMVEGPQKKDRGLELMETNLNNQARAAVAAVKPFADRAKEITVVSGTAYHTGLGGTYEDMMGERLGAKAFGAGFVTPWYKEAHSSGVYYDVAHKQSYTKARKGSPLERELSYMYERLARKGAEIPKYIIMARAHVHFGLKIHQEWRAISVSLPPMKLSDSYGKSGVSPNRTEPENLGIYGVHFDEGKFEHLMFLAEHPEEF